MTLYPSQEVMALRKSGDIRQALARGRELLGQHPSDRYLKGSIGWVLYDLVKAEVARAGSAQGQPPAPGAAAAVQRLLAEYRRLEPARPDLLFSQILFQTVRLPGDIDFLPRFLMWAGPDAYREDDFRSRPGEDGRVFEPLVERAARKAAGAAREQQDPDAQRFVIALIDRALQKAEVQRPEWLNYHKALLLDRLGRHEEATALLVPFVRRKSGEFWAWHAFGKVKEHSDAGLALELYAMALQTCKDPAYGVRVNEDLARVAAAKGHVALARWSAERAAEIRRANGWRIPQSLCDLLDSPWCAAAPEPADPRAELAAHAQGASRILYGDCPRFDATFLGIFVSRTGRPMVKVAVRREADVQELVSPDRDPTLIRNLNVGQSVRVSLLDDAERQLVVEIRGRPEGLPFDCLEEVTGVIDHHNQEKALASVYVTATRFGLLYYADHPQAAAWAPGTAVRMRCIDTDGRLRVYHAEPADLARSAWIRSVRGTLRIHPSGFGFVDDVFVAPHIARDYAHGQEIALVAVRKLNKKTSQMNWTAIGHDASGGVSVS